MNIQSLTAILAGALLLSLVTVESGGLFLVRVATGGAPANALQKSFFRAGHAHAGVLLILSLANFALLGTADLPLWLHLLAGLLPPVAALLMPAGFFLSVLGKDPAKPGRAIALVWAGGAVLALGLIASGLSLILAGAGVI